MSMMQKIGEKHRQVHFEMREAFIRVYLETTGLTVDDIKLVERIVHENDYNNFILRTETHIERKDDDSTKEEISPGEDKGNPRVGYNPTYVDNGGPKCLYCDRCGCYLGRDQQD